MSNVFFTSDTHFKHRLVSGLRGFDPEDTTAHDNHIVETWNSHVKPEDTVFHLGDVGMGNPKNFLPIIERLNGTIHLIAGNHDKVHPMERDSHKHLPAWLEVFASVQAFARRRVNGQEVLLSHFPYVGEGNRPGPDRHTQYRLRDEGLPLIHGHTHDENQRMSWTPNDTLMLHVGWDTWGRPISQDSIHTANLLDSRAVSVVQ